MLRAVCLLFGLVLLPTVVVAQPAATFAELRQVVDDGDSVTVTDMAGERARGRLVRLTAAELVVEHERDRRAWALDEVRSVSARRPDALVNGMLIGLAAGAGAGLFSAGYVDAYLDGAEVSTYALAAALYGAAGVGIGAGIDALIVRDSLVYRRGAGVTRLQVAPWLTGRRRGVRVTVAC